MKKVLFFCLRNNKKLSLLSTVIAFLGILFKITPLIITGLIYILCSCAAMGVVIVMAIFVKLKPQYENKLNAFLESLEK